MKDGAQSDFVNKNPTKIRNEEFAKQFSFKGSKFPVHKREYGKIVKQNNNSTSVFAYEDKTPYHIFTSKQIFENDVYLLLLSNSKNSHYVLIKHFGRFFTNQTKHQCKKHFC